MEENRGEHRRENSFKSVLFDSFKNLLAFSIFVLFAIVIVSVVILAYLGILDFLTALEKTFLVFEGLLGAIIGFYFGYHGIERVEKARGEAEDKRGEAEGKRGEAEEKRDKAEEERGEAVKEKEDAIGDKKESSEVHKRIEGGMESGENKSKKFMEDFIRTHHPETLDEFKTMYMKWRREQSKEGVKGVQDPGVTPWGGKDET